MRIVVHTSAAEAARALADIMAGAIARQPSLVLGLPAGRSPIALYRALVERHRTAQLDFQRVTTFNVDEFVGLPASDAASYAAFMWQHLFQHVNLSRERILLPNGTTTDPRKEAQRYEDAIQTAGGLDIVVLGIGENGHIAFNEPAPSLISDTHVARLHPATRRANADAFGRDWRRVPREGITMGMGTLLRARQVVLLATGAGKARIVARALEGPVTTRVPASLLQLHPNAMAVLDRAAAGKLEIPSRVRS